MVDLKSFFDKLLLMNDSIYLNDEQVKLLKEFTSKHTVFFADLDLENQKILIEICMKNFGVFATLLNLLEFLPASLKYVLISKAMYSNGACGTPPNLTGFKELLDSNQDSWWEDYEDQAYSLREELLRNPVIGIQPILDEFPNCADIEMLISMVNNPIIPIPLLDSIIENDHIVFQEYQDEELSELKAQAIHAKRNKKIYD